MKPSDYILEILLGAFGTDINEVYYLNDTESNVHFIKISPISIIESGENNVFLSDTILQFERKYLGHYLSFVGDEILIQFTKENRIYKKEDTRKSIEYTNKNFLLPMDGLRLSNEELFVWHYSGDIILSTQLFGSKHQEKSISIKLSATYLSSAYDSEISLVPYQEDLIELSEKQTTIIGESNYSFAA